MDSAFNVNIYKLKNYINKKNLAKSFEIEKIMFNAIIDNYPNKIWLQIKGVFFDDLPYDNKEIIIYTILSYKLKKKFLTLDYYLKNDLIKFLLLKKISVYKFEKTTNILLKNDFLFIIKEAYSDHLIRPINLFNIIFKRYEDSTKKEIIYLLNKYIIRHKLFIFNQNYNFKNVYESLKYLIDYTLFDEEYEDIKCILEFHKIENDNTINNIKRDLRNIEESDNNIHDKIKNSLIIAKLYSYEIP